METASFDDFVALNEQLAALVEAGVPLDAGLPASAASDVLERFNATVARRVKRGESLTESLEGDDADVPAGLKNAVQFGLYAGDLSASFQESSRVAETIDESRRVVEGSFVYPLVVCALAYAGLIGFSLFLVPRLEAIYVSFETQPGPGLRLLNAVRAAMPLWSTLLPLGLIAVVVWRVRRRHVEGHRTTWYGLFRWLPGASSIVFQERCSRFSASLAALLGKQVPLHEALTIAGPLCGDARLSDGARTLAAAEHESAWPGDDSDVARQFPPFLRWAIWHSPATMGRVRALEIASDMYREAARRRAERFRARVPLAILVLVGGGVTLLYGLALFVPLVELLRTLAL